MPLADKKIIEDRDRLDVLRDLALLTASREPFFDHLTALASRVIGAPVSLVSMVASDYQFFKSSYGLAEPLHSQRGTPITHAFCQHVVATGEPLVVNDAREHELVKDNGSLHDHGVIGYLGIPLHTGNKELGSFCLFEYEPREWSDEEVNIMQKFADLVNLEIDARARAKARGTLEEHIIDTRNLVDEKISHMDVDTPRRAVIAELLRIGDHLDSLYY